MRKVVIASFVSAVKYKGKKDIYTEIFKNPTKSELQDAYASLYSDTEGHVRFILFPEAQAIFVFNAQLLHTTALQEISKEECGLKEPYLFGTGVVKGGKIYKIELEDDPDIYDFVFSDEVWSHRWLTSSISSRGSKK